jgi:Uma2 family endonuclease
MSQARVHHRFSVAEYERMIQTGILTESDRVELIRGEIVAKMTVGNEHAACVKRLNAYFSQLLGHKIVISIQDPIQLEESVPEPDVVLLKSDADYYAKRRPLPVDILLLIEVADTSLDNDREVKAVLYAENGIVEYWIVNLFEKNLEVYRQLQSRGGYSEMLILRPGDEVELSALPGIIVEVEKIIGE